MKNKNIAISIIAPVVAFVLLLSACKKEVLPVKEEVAKKSNVKSFAANPEIFTTVYIDNPTGPNKLKARLFIPASDNAVPAVVVMHGCGGLWSNDNSNGDLMQEQFETWVDSFRTKGIAAIFVDSYTARGEVNFCGKKPPFNYPIAAEYVRPRDAYNALAYLRTNSRINGSKIALMGFSHGGTTALATVVDADYVTAGRTTPWSMTNDKVVTTDGVLAPASKPAEGGFVAAVSFYPGASFYSYFGQPGTPNSGKYKNYAPILLFGAGKDPLYTATYTNWSATPNTTALSYDCFKNKAQYNNGAPVQLVTYANASHSFDGKTSGDDGTASTDARKRTLEFLQPYLF